MKAILVTCPHCGARLQIADAAASVDCSYCGTSSRVQRRTQFFERALPPPASGPAPVAVQRHTGVAGGRVVLGLALPLVIGGMVYFQVSKARRLVTQSSSVAVTSSSTKTTVTLPGEAPGQQTEWQGTVGALVVDIDGNGTPELVGRSRRVSVGDEIRLIALDAATGARRWQSEPLGSYTDTYQGQLALAGDQLLFASPRGEVRAFALATGQPRWRTQLDEKVRALCDGGADTIIAIGADDRPRPLRRADGTPAGTTLERPAAAPPRRPGRRGPACAHPLVTDAVDQPRGDARPLAAAHGLRSERLDGGPGERVLSGSRATGTGVPTMIAFDDRDKVRWTVAIPQDPLGAQENAPEAVAVGRGSACATYQGPPSERTGRVACFALADGRRQWDHLIPNHSLRMLQIVGDAVAITGVGRLELRDLATGAVRWSFGR